MQRIISTLCFLLIVSQATAVNYYTLQKLQAAYVPLTNDTAVPLITTTANQGYEYLIEMKGTTVSLFQNNYTMNDSNVFLYFSTDGHLGIQDDTSFIIFDGLFIYLDSIDATSKVSYKVEGTGMNRIVKLQFKNLMLRDGPVGNYANFQIWYYMMNGVVEMRYGPSSASNATGYTNVTGPNVGMFYSNKTFTKMFEKIWLNGNPTSYTIDSAKTVVFNSMHGVPAEGTIYRFGPKKVLSVDDVSAVKAMFSIAPNPVTDKLHVSSDGKQPCNYMVTDINGKKLSGGTLSPGINDVSTGQLPVGYYLLHIAEPGSGRRSEIRFLKN